MRVEGRGYRLAFPLDLVEDMRRHRYRVDGKGRRRPFQFAVTLDSVHVNARRPDPFVSNPKCHAGRLGPPSATGG